LRQSVTQGILPVGWQGEVGLGGGIQGEAEEKAKAEAKNKVEGERKTSICSLTGR